MHLLACTLAVRAELMAMLEDLPALVRSVQRSLAETHVTDMSGSNILYECKRVLI
jgi:hypothetical protein